ncbi:UDP-xylose and UDP-N-acetylglucosamine transporter [Trichostrongylus colubriformis]|uniref:UDP-xylose and UDP-N-acetylglucosamine transporter n=1 Tax=Trichostrongylus colubriformis TaxID=6319 RepID=A0AAN8F1G1_TRICO
MTLLSVDQVREIVQGSLLANIILGFTLRNRFYTRKQIASVIAVTCGIIIFTLASYNPSAYPKTSDSVRFFSIQPFFTGIFLLTAALLLSAYLGVCQEDMYGTYGKHAKESMFMVHFLSIPAYALLGNEITDAFHATNITPPLSIFGYDLLLPRAWAYILGICVLQYICINNVYRLTALTTSLNVTMVITLRKFLSLFVSFVVFNNSFNILHFVGATFVFLGSLMFSNIV